VASARAGCATSFPDRPQAGRIIFVDEIDSVAKARLASGGGHDEREQTLNQMLNEMDGLRPAEGGHSSPPPTGRHLGPALFARAASTARSSSPPDLDERLPILQVNCRGKRIVPTRPRAGGARARRHERRGPGQPGQRGGTARPCAGFGHHRDGRLESSRDRVLMASGAESLVLSPDEKERVAYHEGGQPCGLRLEHADVHKVTIPATAWRSRDPAAADRRAPHPPASTSRTPLRAHGGRVAELLVYGRPLDRGGQRPRRQHRAGPQMVVSGHERRDRPMAWAPGPVFLARPDATRDYSEDTSRVIDDSRAHPARARRARPSRCEQAPDGLEASPDALGARDGRRPGRRRLVDEAFGERPRQWRQSVPHFTVGRERQRQRHQLHNATAPSHRWVRDAPAAAPPPRVPRHRAPGDSRRIPAVDAGTVCAEWPPADLARPS